MLFKTKRVYMKEDFCKFSLTPAVAVSNKCTTQELSSILTSCFKTIVIHYKEYCEGELV